MKNILPFQIGTVHFIGIGGIGMSGIAEVLNHLGYQVQGSDQAENANTQRLSQAGVRVMLGHAADHILNDQGEACAVVVRSSAVKDDNVEVQAARAAKIPVILRADMLAEIMRLKWAITIAGTHGKTTTTSMVGRALEKAGLDPTVINGGVVNAYGSNARMGESNWMVVEADESDGTFTRLPAVAEVITNIDAEHMEHYGSFDKVLAAYKEFVANMPFYGFVALCSDNPALADLAPALPRKVISYGLNDQADVRAYNIRNEAEGQVFDIAFSSRLKHYDQNLENVMLPMFGRHNVLNSLSAFAIAHELKIPAQTVADALQNFKGVKRRFSKTGCAAGVTVIDDYAHHPAEITAVLGAARDAVQARGTGRVIAVMQPHRYSRLKNLFSEFSACFEKADHIFIADVYAAGEQKMDQIDKEHLIAEIKKTGKKSVHPVQDPARLANQVAEVAASGDFVICMGAGSITHWAQALPAQLQDLLGEKIPT